jgi:hypothetical protein
MTKAEPIELRAKITVWNGVVRGVSPAGLSRYFGAKGGDYLVYRIDEDGKCTVRLSRSKQTKKKAVKRG